MGNVTLNGSTSGSITLAPVAVAGSNTITLPAATGTVLTTAGGQTITGTTTVSSLAMNGATSGTTTLSPSAIASGTITLPAGTGTVAVNGVSSNIVSGTSQASTSGTVIDFTGIPSWAKRITVMFNQVSTNSTSNYLIQLGTSGGFGSTTYSSGAGVGGTYVVSTTGLILTAGSVTAASLYSGSVAITSFGSNIWTSSGILISSASAGTYPSSGTATTNATLTQVRITTVTPDTFDAGSINILYE